MRTLALLATLLAATACTSRGSADAAADATTEPATTMPSNPPSNRPVSAPAGTRVEFRIAGEGAFAQYTEAGAIVARDEAAYRERWASLIGGGAPPAVDFATETAVFLFGGQRPTGGYEMVVRGATLEGDTLVVEGDVQSPPSGTMVTQVLTSPYAVIAARSRAFTSARWSR